MFDPIVLARRNIQKLRPYSSARHEFAGTADVYIDANENSMGSPAGGGLNRYPDPLQSDLKKLLATAKGLSADRIFVGNGSDEAIDLLFRVFCEPRRDRALIFPPTYGMYKVAAAINDVAVDEVFLTSEFQLDLPNIIDRLNAETKLVFICSPNNPTGNSIRRDDIVTVLQRAEGLVIVDEAYVDFSVFPSVTRLIDEYPNLVVLQTFSKAWGLAGARVGLAFADERVISLLNRVKPPYNVSRPAQNVAIDALSEPSNIDKWKEEILTERKALKAFLGQLTFVLAVYPSDANFLLVKFTDAAVVYRFLLDRRIVVRDRSSEPFCEGCLRITVGTRHENRLLMSSLTEFAGRTNDAAASKFQQ
ncbi:MAG: histidinol-phosphate transaminase [Pyrinomonadaceae bacterium]